MKNKKRKKYRSPKKLFLIVSIILIAIIFFAIFYYLELPLYFIWLLTLTIVTFLFYGYDKFMAINYGGRIPKIVLHILSLVGGFAGGWLGMIVFRHKKRKTSFFVILLLATVIHLLLITYFYPEILHNIEITI